MRWVTVLLAVFLTWINATGYPNVHLKLIDSASWDSSFKIQLTPEQEQEIQNICEEMNPNRRSNIVYSPNGKFRIEYKAYSVHQKDDLTVEASFYDSTGEKLWEDTLSFIPEISNNGEWIYGSDNEGCGMISFNQAKPRFRPVKLGGECFHQRQISWDGQFIAAVATELIIFRYDGEELWRSKLGRGNKMVRITVDSKFIIVASYNHPREMGVGYSILYFFTRDGQLLRSFKVSGNQFRVPPILHSIYISPDGKLTIADLDATLLGFETKTGNKIWNYHYPDLFWLISDLVFVPGTEFFAVSIVHALNKAHRRFVHVFDLSGNIQNNFLVEIVDDFRNTRQGAKIRVTSDGQYIIAGTPNRKHLIELFR